MPQFRIHQGHSIGAIATLSPEDSKHLARVLRARAGEWVFLYDGENRFEAEIVSLSPKQVTARIARILPKTVIKGELLLCQSVLKKDKMEFVIQKGAELGASSIYPFYSERTIPKGERVDRWQKIADEAAKQCGRVAPLAIHTPLTLKSLLEELRDVPKIFFWEAEESHCSTFVKEIGAQDRLALIIGPEGGFAQTEVKLARENGCQIASLGPLILRAETAAIAALTLAQHGLGNL